MNKTLVVSLCSLVVISCGIAYQQCYNSKIQEPKEVEFTNHSLDIKELAIEGLKTPIWFVKTKNPTFCINITFRNEGMRNFNKSLPCILDIIAATALDGAGKFGRSELKEEFLYNNISASIRYNQDDVIVSCYSVSRNFEHSMALLADVLTRAHLTASDIDRVKNNVIEDIQQSMALPKFIASQKMRSFEYGESHPYYVDYATIVDSIKDISRADILRVYNQIFDPKDAEITIAGDLNKDDITRIIQPLIKALASSKSNDFSKQKEEYTLKSGGICVHKKQKTPQTFVMFSHPGLPSKSDERYALNTGLRILGRNGFNSRFFKDIRTKQGLTYGISCSLSESDMIIKISGSGSTRPQNKDKLIASVKDHFKQIRLNGVSAEELETEKRSMFSSDSLTSASDIVSHLVGCRRRNVKIQDVNAYMQRYYELTVADVNKALRKYIDENKLIFVSVGMDEGVAGSKEEK